MYSSTFVHKYYNIYGSTTNAYKNMDEACHDHMH